MNWLKKLWNWLFPWPFRAQAAGPIFWMNKAIWIDSSGTQQTSWFNQNGMTLPNAATQNIIVLGGLYQPSAPLWFSSIHVDGVDYPITMDDGVWAASIPSSQFAPNSVSVIVIAASRNGVPVVGLEPYHIVFTGNQ